MGGRVSDMLVWKVCDRGPLADRIDMPVVRSDDNPFGLDEEDRIKLHYRPPARLDASEAGPSTSNATGQHLEVDADIRVGDDWRKRSELDEGDYTRIRLNEDEESEEVHMRTRYLFDEGKAMTPLSQMQATKELLTEGQRIAYVGLCQLIATRMLRDMARGWTGKKLKGLAKMKGKGKEEIPVVESGNIWMIKIMARLYQHMEVERDGELQGVALCLVRSSDRDRSFHCPLPSPGSLE